MSGGLHSPPWFGLHPTNFISRRVILKHLAFGFVAGVMTSIAPIEFAILLVPGLLVVRVLAFRRRPPGFGLTSYIIAVLAALLAIGISSSDPTPVSLG